MSEFDDLLASLGADTERLPLPPPADLRAIGDARTRRNVVAMASLVAVIVVGLLAGAGLVLASPRALPQEPASVGPPAVSPTVSPVIQTPTDAPSTTWVPVAGAPCTAAGIELISALAQGAHGIASVTVAVRNSGAVSCTLTGAPRLRYVTDGGASAEVPAQYVQGGGPVLVQPGGQALFNVSWINGYAGFQPGSPQCAHPAQYGHLSVVLNDGSVVPLSVISSVYAPPTSPASAVIAIQCGSIEVSSWSASGN
jgi:hypothetical protein